VVLQVIYRGSVGGLLFDSGPMAPRHREVVELWCQGFSWKEVAEATGSLARTLATDISELMISPPRAITPSRRGIRHPFCRDG
jgi:hypothetical protein